MKHKIFITASFILLTVFAKAQDKYQFMAITFTTYKSHINVSIDGEQCLREDIDIADNEKGCVNPLLKKVKEYQDKGWEVMSFSNNSQSGLNPDYTCYLRKKIESK